MNKGCLYPECARLHDSRGFCKSHATKLRKKGLLKDFGIVHNISYKDSNYKVIKEPKKGRCRVTHDKTPCPKKIKARGLCQGHMSFFIREGTLNKYAFKSLTVHWDSAHFEILSRPKKGICHIKENNEACKNKIDCRGLCKRHHVLFSKRDKLEVYGRKQLPKNFERNTQTKKGYCYLITDGNKCQKQIRARRLCLTCYNMLYKRGGLERY